MNIPNPKIINTDNVTEAQEVAALDISFTDSEAIAGQMIWKGTFIVGNKYTSLRLKNSIWLGGQIILAGGRLELIDSSVLCGKYAANRPCLPLEDTSSITMANNKVDPDGADIPWEIDCKKPEAKLDIKGNCKQECCSGKCNRKKTKCQKEPIG